MNRVDGNLNKHIKDNIWLYTSCILCIFIGMILGVYYLKYMGQADRNNINNYLNQFLKNISVTNLNMKYIFQRVLKNTIPFILLIWFLGLTVVGIPLILILDVLKGFVLGFSISSLVNNLGGKGILVVVAGVIPQNIIYIPAIIFISVVAMKFSLGIIRNKMNKQWTTNIVNKFISYSVLIFIASLICFIGFFIEAYFTPNIIKLLV